MMLRSGLLGRFLAVALVAAACGDAGEPATTEAAPRLVRFERTGGLEGLEEAWTIHADGRIVDQAGSQRQADPGAVAALHAAIGEPGFYELDDAYLPIDPCCDRFTYVVTVENGRTHRVETMDGVDEAPAELWDIIGRLLDLVGS